MRTKIGEVKKNPQKRLPVINLSRLGHQELLTMLARAKQRNDYRTITRIALEALKRRPFSWAKKKFKVEDPPHQVPRIRRK